MIERWLHKNHPDILRRSISVPPSPALRAVCSAIFAAVVAFPAVSAAANNEFIVYSGQDAVVAVGTYDNELNADLVISAGQNLNIIGRTAKDTLSDKDSSLDGVFNTYAIKNFNGHQLKVEADANLLIQGGMVLTINLKYVNEKGEEISHVVPAKGIYGLGVGNGEIVNAGTMTVTTGFCDYDNGIENLATTGTTAALDNSGTLSFLGGSSDSGHADLGQNGAYGMNNMAYGSGSKATLTNSGSLIVSGGETAFRYGIQTLAFNASEEEAAEVARAVLSNTGSIQIKGGSALSAVGIFSLASGAKAKASLDNHALSDAGGGISIVGGSSFEHDNALEKAAYGVYAFALNGGQAEIVNKKNSGIKIQGGSGAHSHGVLAVSKQVGSNTLLQNLGTLQIIGGTEENAHGIYALSTEEGKTTLKVSDTNASLIIRGGSKNFTNGIHSLARKKGTTEFLGESGTVEITGSSENAADAYGVRYFSHNGGTTTVTNSGAKIVISGGSLGTNSTVESAAESQYRNYGVYALASNRDSDTTEDYPGLAKVEISNAAELEIKAGNALNAYGIYTFTEELSEAVITNTGTLKISGEDSISVSAVRYMSRGSDGSKAQIVNNANGTITIQAGEHAGSYGIHTMQGGSEGSEASITNNAGGTIELLGSKLGYAIGMANGTIVNSAGAAMVFNEKPIEVLSGTFENAGSIATPSAVIFTPLEVTKREVNAELKLAISDGADKADNAKFTEIEETGVTSSVKDDWKEHLDWRGGTLTINNYRDDTLEAAKLRELAKEAWNIAEDEVVFTGTAGLVSGDLVRATQGLNHTTLHMMFDNNQLADGDVILQFAVKDGQPSTESAPYDARNEAVLISNKESTIPDGGVDDVTSRQNIGFTHIINSTAITISHDLNLRLVGLTDEQWGESSDKAIAVNDITLNRGTLTLGLAGEDHQARNGKLLSILGSTGSALEVVNGTYEIQALKALDALNHDPDLRIVGGSLTADAINAASVETAEETDLTVTNGLTLSGGSVRTEESVNAGTITAGSFTLNQSALTDKGTLMTNSGTLAVSGTAELKDSSFTNAPGGTFQANDIILKDASILNTGADDAAGEGRIIAESASITVEREGQNAFIDNAGSLTIKTIEVGENAHFYNQAGGSAGIETKLTVNGIFGDYGSSAVQELELGSTGALVFNKGEAETTSYQNVTAAEGAKIDLVKGTLALEKLDADNITFTQNGGSFSVNEGWFKNSAINIYGGSISLEELGDNNVYTIKGTGRAEVGTLSDTSSLYLYSDGVVEAEKLDYSGEDKKFFLEGGTLLTDATQIFDDIVYEAIDIDTGELADVSLSNIISDVGGIKESVAKALNFNYGLLAFTNDFSNEQVYSKILKTVNTTADSVGNKIFVAFNNTPDSDNGLRDFTLDT